MGDLKVLKSTIENIDGSKSYLLGATMEKQGVSEERTKFPFKIVLQFPSKSSNDDLIKEEIRTIMTSSLHEQLGITS